MSRGQGIHSVVQTHPEYRNDNYARKNLWEFHYISGRSLFNPRSRHTIPPCLTLSNIRYVSRVKWSNPGKGVRPSQYLGIVAIEKGAFWSPSTTVTNPNHTHTRVYKFI